jgi:hypothetical protein
MEPLEDLCCQLRTVQYLLECLFQLGRQVRFKKGVNMQLLLTTILFFFTFVSIQTDDSKYEKAMKKNLSRIDSALDVTSILTVANGFERIAFAEKDKWLPYYYASFMYVLAGFSDTTVSKKDGYLDKADTFINIADSLEENESEIYTLKGMIAQARMQVDPMNRWKK